MKIAWERVVAGPGMGQPVVDLASDRSAEIGLALRCQESRLHRLDHRNGPAMHRRFREGEKHVAIVDIVRQQPRGILMIEDNGELVECQIRINAGNAESRESIVPAPDVDHMVLGHIDRRTGQRTAGGDCIGPEQIACQAMRFRLIHMALRHPLMPRDKLRAYAGKSFLEGAGTIGWRHRAEEINIALE